MRPVKRIANEMTKKVEAFIDNAANNDEDLDFESMLAGDEDVSLSDITGFSTKLIYSGMDYDQYSESRIQYVFEVSEEGSPAVHLIGISASHNSWDDGSDWTTSKFKPVAEEQVTVYVEEQ